MDESVLGDDVHRINELTVIASESYKEFTTGIQRQIALGIDDRPAKVNPDLFTNRTVMISGQSKTIKKEVAEEIFLDLIINGYVSKTDKLPTEKYHEAKKVGILELSETTKQYEQIVFEVMDSVFNPDSIKIKNARDDNVIAKIKKDNFEKQEFNDLWHKISKKTAYTVNFDTVELVKNCIEKLDSDLKVSNIIIVVERGKLEKISSKLEMESASGFSDHSKEVKNIESAANISVKYDLIGKIVDGTSLTRRTISDILKGIKEVTFNKFRNNPEEFISNSIRLINQEKATAIVQSIVYDPLNDSYGTDIFTSATIKGKLGTNMMVSKRGIFDYTEYDSTTIEKPFAENLDASDDVIVYAKIPVRDNGFKIHTPMGNYTPDWAIAFKRESIKHIYFVAETKGSLNSLELKGIENAKIACAKKHFEAICSDDVRYDVVRSFDDLLKLVTE